MPPLFVLIHSPLVGPLTWSLVAEELRQRGSAAVTPSLLVPQRDGGPHWRRHVAAVTGALCDVPPDQPLVLVAHSGAGPLLPAVGQGIGRPVAGYLFVDAALPGADGQSRLDLFAPAEAEQFRASAADGTIGSAWRNDDVLLAAGISDPDLRRRFAAEVTDVPLSVYEEPLPVPAGWPDAPCGYLLFSAPYETDAYRASIPDWPVGELRGGHFQMLADPALVTDALLDLVREMEIA